MGRSSKQSKDLGTLVDAVGDKRKPRRRGRKLLLLGLAGIAAAVAKSRCGAAPVATPVPRPAPPVDTAPVPAPEPTSAPALPVEPQAGEAEPAPEPVAETVVPPLPEPLLEQPAPEPVAETAAVKAAPDASPLTDTAQLDDIVEVPWTDEDVTPIAQEVAASEAPTGSLSSFFDEVMTETAEQKQRKGH